MNKLQLPVGGVFEFTKGEDNPQAVHHARVVEIPQNTLDGPCKGCIFEEGTAENCKLFACLPHERTDAKNVSFLEVKGGVA